MSYPSPDLSVSLRTDGVALGEFIAVDIDASGEVGVATAGAAMDGIFQEGGATGVNQSGQLVFGGKSKAIAGANLTAGTTRALMVGTTGRLIAYVAAAANVHVANWLPDEDTLTAVANDQIRVALVGSPLDR